MAITEKINQYVQQLPEQMQSEVLDFVQYLLSKVEREGGDNGNDWSYLSLALAMRGMEDEEGPEYSADDLKEAFQ